MFVLLLLLDNRFRFLFVTCVQFRIFGPLVGGPWKVEKIGRKYRVIKYLASFELCNEDIKKNSG